MNLSLIDRFRRSGRLLAGLGLAVGVTAVFSATQVLGGEPESGNNGDRGENPVVGSLPCEVDDSMDLLFWEGMNQPDPGMLPMVYPVTFGICSEDIRGNVLDAHGEPYGKLNDRWDWRALGLQKQAQVLVESDVVRSGEVSMWIWAPAAYRGGELAMDSPFGSHRVKLGRDARELPIADLVEMSGEAVTITRFTIKPPVGSGLPVIRARLSVVGSLTAIEYL